MALVMLNDSFQRHNNTFARRPIQSRPRSARWSQPPAHSPMLHGSCPYARARGFPGKLVCVARSSFAVDLQIQATCESFSYSITSSAYLGSYMRDKAFDYMLVLSQLKSTSWTAEIHIRASRGPQPVFASLRAPGGCGRARQFGGNVWMPPASCETHTRALLVPLFPLASPPLS